MRSDRATLRRSRPATALGDRTAGHRLWATAACLLLPAAIGCRELVQPQAPAKLTGFAAGIVATADGRLLADAEVILSNYSYASTSQQRTYWRGGTSSGGRFTSDVPSGQYFDVEVRYPYAVSLSNWTFLAVWFGDTPVELRPEPMIQVGQLHLPVGLSVPIDDGAGSFDRRYRAVTQDWHLEHAWFHNIEPQGMFEVQLRSPGRYDVSMDAYFANARLSVGFADSVEANTSDTLHFHPPLIRIVVRASLGGDESVVTPVDLRLDSIDTGSRLDWAKYYAEVESGSPLAAWGVAHPARLLVAPRLSAPFLPVSLAITPEADAEFELELGLHEVIAQVLGATGAPAIGARVRFQRFVDTWNAVEAAVSTSTDGRAICFLNPGTYVVTAELRSTERAITTIQVDGPLTFVLQLPAGAAQ